jgi:hypothetical protein
MIVDAGGGTTVSNSGSFSECSITLWQDVALLKVEKKDGARPSLRSLDEVRGEL